MAKNVSNNFKNVIKNGGPFYAYASVLFADGSSRIMTSETDFSQTGNSYSEDGETGFPLGSALSKSITLNVDASSSNKDVDYYQARITLYTEADLPDGTTERIQEGIFTVIDSVTPGEILEITAYDDMYKADTPFTSLLSYPASAQALLNEVCAQCGITLGSASFHNNDFQIQQAPDGLTGRQVIGYIAQIAGGNAVIDRNARLVIKTYDFSGFNQTENVSADEIETESGIHIISQYVNDPDIGTDDVTITGVTVEIDNEDSGNTKTYTSGTEEYALRIDNPLIAGKEKEAVDLIADVVVGITVRPFSGTFMPDPTIEFMDLAYLVDKKDNQYKTFVTTHDFEYLSNSTLSNGTESPERHGGSYYSTAAEVYQKAKKDLKINRTQWEQAIENLSQQVANASGLYTTEEEQPDGSTIFYMHNKPTLEESDIVWKMTAETLTVSTDGGHSWNAGITVNGEVIARIMNTIGINFDWGVGGTLIIQDEEGNQTAYIDAETGTVRLAVESLTITGKTVQEIASEQSDETLNNFVDSVYNPAIGNLQAQIDGQIETYYYDYEPTLNNEPASEWTTEKERMAHEGDLFYWKSKGYAYRFFKDGDSWKWQMVQDTDITKALEQAATAQDTADQKRRVFVTQPYPPYDVGDLWVGDDTSEMMRCQRARSSGSYVASDWIKAVKYTDDSELYNFVQNDYNETIKELYNSVDQKSETWYQATDPALEWTEVESTPLQDTTGANILDTAGETIITIWEKEKSLHNGDLWKNSTTNKEYLYQNGEWVEMPIPDEVFDMIDGKAQIFVAQPTPPYDVGDVWFTGTTILVCNTKRENGSFSESDWGKKDNYTDDSALYSFIEGDYSNTVEELKTQADKKAETWYQSTDPSTGWTAAEKQTHTGDLWYNTSDEKTYIYNGSAWELTKTTPPDEVFDQIDGKAQIFIAQPTPPYQKGDLWFNSATSDIMTCINSRSSGNYTASDWQKRNKYTDDSYAQEVNKELNQFISGYQDEIKEIQNQVDQKAETWYQTSDPALQWTGKENIPLADTTGASILDTTGSTITTIWESEKMVHDGDLWHNPSNNKEYIYQDGEWNETSIPDDVFDIIDGKAQIFVSQPKPPYSVGDLWFNSATSDIMTCVQSRSSGSYTAGDWQKRNKYTDDTYAQDVAKELLDFSDAVTGDISSLQSQLDGKIETFYYNYKPTLSNLPASGWKTDAERARHVGDLFYWQSQGYTYRFQTSGSTYVWQQIQDSQITEAMEEASKAQDTADSKRRVFVTTPVPPYDVGDLWVGNSSSDLMRCQTARGSGSFSSSDWIKAVKYTDDSAVDSLDQSLNQQDIFNRLTNNGQTQGIYLNNGKLYINATYIHGGQLSLGGTNNTNGSILILDASGNQIGTIDRNGINAQGDFEIKKAVSPWNFDAAFKNVTVFHYGRSIQRGGLRVTAQTSDGAGYEGDIIISPAPYTNTNSYTDRAYAIIQSNRALAIQSKIEDDEQWGRIDMEGPEFTISTGKGNMSAPAFSTSAADGGSSPTSTIMRSKNASIKCATNIALTGNTEITGSLSATGSKNRIVKTPNYGDRLQYCYEMTNPMFGDIGEAKTDENGECYLYIDDIFKETVTTNIEYQVFLQKEGQGDVWIEEKNEEYFAVKGTPNLKFAWEIKAKQKEYEYERLKMHEEESDVYEEDYAKTAQKEIENSINDYEEQAIKMMEEYYSMMEGEII